MEQIPTKKSFLDTIAEKLNVDRRKTRIPILRKASLLEKRANMGWLFVLPFALGLLLVYLPIILDSFWFSFCKVQVLPDRTEITNYGLSIYQKALDTTFLQNLLKGFEQLLLNVPAILVFSLFVAVILNQKMAGRAAFRAIFFVPVILSTGLMESINAVSLDVSATTGIDDGSGEQQLSLDIEKLFSSMKVGTELVTYVTDLVARVYSIINYSGVQMLIFLAGLQSISPSIYEACKMEGATSWETFWKITFPMISPMILVNGIYTIIDSFTRSDNVVMSTINAIYNTATLDNRMLATAQSWIYFGMVLLVIAAFAGLASLFVFYQKRD